MKANKKIPRQSSSLRSRRSVKFNLDKNSTCKYESAYSSKDWYSCAQIDSFYKGAVRTAMAYRNMVTALRKMQERSKQHDYLASALRLQRQEDDVLCIHGIEHLVVSDSVRMRLKSAKHQVNRVIMEAQAQPGKRCFISLAKMSIKHSSIMKDRAIKIAMYHARHAN